MALTYDGSNGLFTRLGKIFGLAEAVRTHQSDIRTRIAGIQGEFTSTDAYMVGNLVANMEARIDAAGAIFDDIQTAAVTTLIEMIYADSLVTTRGILPTRTVEDALRYLISEMALDSESVETTTISKSAVATGPANTGDGTFVWTEKPPLSLDCGTTQYPNIRTEIVQMRCVDDAQSGAIPAGSEVFELRGGVAYPNGDYRFPGGSGLRMRMPCLNPAIDAGARYESQLRNGHFSTFDTTADVPDYFTVSTGVAGTNFAESATAFRGSSGLELIGDGSTNPKIRQLLASSSGSPGTIYADRLYVIGAATKTDGAATAGVVRLSLQDAAGTVITGANVTWTYTIGGSWSWQTAFFRAPLSLPSSIYFVVETTTAISNTHKIYVDECVLAEVRQIAPGGTGIVILPGETDWVVNDSLRLKATNLAEGEFHTEFDRFFRTYQSGLVLPSDASPTISDTLIS